MNNRLNKWYADEKSDILPIISSRVRLARNIKKYPFLARIDNDGSQKIVEEMVGFLGHYFPPAHFSGKSIAEKLTMMERHNVSPEFIRIEKPKELLFQDDEKINIMINEEDHIRIQTISPGDDIEGAFSTDRKSVV